VYANVKWIQPTALTESEAERVERMVHAHGRLVFSIAYSILRNPQDAEDAAQEVFLRVMRYRYRWAFIRDERTFLGRIAQRTAIDRRKRQREHISMDEIAEPMAASRNHEREEELATLAALLRALPEDLREVLELSQVEELTSEEIAKVLRIPAGTVRSRLSRARSMLKEKWQAIKEATRENKYAP
jgi:RNA polymerase sigma-70 factor (ECF subfamily)